MPSDSTRQKLLDTAERLFADHGIGAISLREIIRTAGVNVAAIHYHFGSKDELIRAVFSRRISAVNQARLSGLEELREAHGSEPIPLRPLLRAFIAPALALGSDQSSGGKEFFRLVARAHAEPTPVVKEVLFTELKDIIETFLSELERTVPHLSRAERAMRLSFAAGAMVHTVLFPLKPMFMESFGGGELATQEPLDLLVEFCTAGMSAAGGVE